MRLLVLALAIVPVLGEADATADPPKLTLEQVIAKAVANPRVQMADADRDAAEGKVDEADAAMLPRIKGTAFGTISPEIRCLDYPACTETTPKNFAFRFDGFFGGAQ